MLIVEGAFGKSLPLTVAHVSIDGRFGRFRGRRSGHRADIANRSFMTQYGSWVIAFDHVTSRICAVGNSHPLRSQGFLRVDTLVCWSAMAFDVFISYPHQDKATADAACAALENTGIRCWIAPRDVPPGAEWAGAIVDAIDHCRAMVLIFSSSTNGSKQIHREVQRAFDGEKPVVPLRIENVAPQKSLAYYMGPVHWLDALTPPVEQHLQKLVASIQPLVGAVEKEHLRSEIEPSQRAEQREALPQAGDDRDRQVEPVPRDAETAGIDWACRNGTEFLHGFGAYMDGDARKELENAVQKAKHALMSGDKRGGVTAQSVIESKVQGSGFASLMYVAEKAMLTANVKQASVLAQAIGALRQVYKYGDAGFEFERLAQEARVILARITNVEVDAIPTVRTNTPRKPSEE
jgi:hypothetical protein